MLGQMKARGQLRGNSLFDIVAAALWLTPE
jgi:hypothetical protein